eukprot:scaffold7409_cov75-Isochrysis_galbana.AAC.2
MGSAPAAPAERAPHGYRQRTAAGGCGRRLGLTTPAIRQGASAIGWRTGGEGRRRTGGRGRCTGRGRRRALAAGRARLGAVGLAGASGARVLVVGDCAHGGRG